MSFWARSVGIYNDERCKNGAISKELILSKLTNLINILKPIQDEKYQIHEQSEMENMMQYF